MRTFEVQIRTSKDYIFHVEADDQDSAIAIALSSELKASKEIEHYPEVKNIHRLKS